MAAGCVKFTNIVITTLLCLMLAFCNVLFMILTYAQLGDSAPLLYMEYIFYYSMILIWFGRLLRTIYKRIASKRGLGTNNDSREKNPVITSDQTGKKLISLEVLRMSTETKSLK